MHAWLCENPTGIDALNWKELPTPAPKAGEVLIAIKAASLNFRMYSKYLNPQIRTYNFDLAKLLP